MDYRDTASREEEEPLVCSCPECGSENLRDGPDEGGVACGDCGHSFRPLATMRQVRAMVEESDIGREAIDNGFGSYPTPVEPNWCRMGVIAECLSPKGTEKVQVQEKNGSLSGQLADSSMMEKAWRVFEKEILDAGDYWYESRGNRLVFKESIEEGRVAVEPNYSKIIPHLKRMSAIRIKVIPGASTIQSLIRAIEEAAKQKDKKAVRDLTDRMKQSFSYQLSGHGREKPFLDSYEQLRNLVFPSRVKESENSCRMGVIAECLSPKGTEKVQVQKEKNPLEGFMGPKDTWEYLEEGWWQDLKDKTRALVKRGLDRLRGYLDSKDEEVLKKAKEEMERFETLKKEYEKRKEDAKNRVEDLASREGISKEQAEEDSRGLIDRIHDWWQRTVTAWADALDDTLPALSGQAGGGKGLTAPKTVVYTGTGSYRESTSVPGYYQAILDKPRVRQKSIVEIEKECRDLFERLPTQFLQEYDARKWEWESFWPDPEKRLLVEHEWLQARIL